MAGHWGEASQIIERLAGDGCHPKRISCDAGTVIHESDSPADSFFLIETGEVRIYHVKESGASRVVDILGPGDWFGTAVLAHLPTFGKRAVAIQSSIVWKISADELRRELTRHGDIALSLLKSIAARLLDAWNHDSAMIAQSCKTRIIKTLLRFSTSSAAESAPPESTGAESTQGESAPGEITLHMTHAQLARVIGAARESVSACLTELRHKKIIRTGRNKLKFNPQRLRELENA
jgi:CRP/FNR family transcriptional regulator